MIDFSPLQVGGAGHRDVESVEPGLPSECDCALCGPTDHIKWETLPNMMASTRSGQTHVQIIISFLEFVDQ